MRLLYSYVACSLLWHFLHRACFSVIGGKQYHWSKLRVFFFLQPLMRNELDGKTAPAHTCFALLFFMEVSQWFASIDSHAWPVSSAVTPLCTDLVQWEPCLAQCAQGRGISAGFQRRAGGGICYASEIIAACGSQWTGAVLICKHSGRGRARTAHVMKVCVVPFSH